MRLPLIFSLFSAVSALTCYNGGKLLSMQSIGQSTEECAAGAYCYNMTANAYFVVDAVKAGCSTWRCMLAKNTCISTYFQMVPVSLCCCDSDRCNVAGNPQYDSNPANINRGSGYDNNGGNNQNDWNNNNKGGSGYDYNYGGNTNNNNKQAGSGYDYNYGETNNQKGNWGSSFSQPSAARGGATQKPLSRKEMEDRFRNTHIDEKDDTTTTTTGGGGDIEEPFARVDARTTPPPSRRGSVRGGSGSTGGGGRGNDEEISIP